MHPGTTIERLKIRFFIPGPSGPLSRFVNVFLIATPEFLTLIDTGIAGSEEHIFRWIQDLGRKPEEIAYTFLTHAMDHIGAAGAIREATGCMIAAHGADQAWIEDPALQNRERPVPGFFQLIGGPVPVDRVLNDGEIIKLGEGWPWRSSIPRVIHRGQCRCSSSPGRHSSRAMRSRSPMIYPFTMIR